MYIPGKKLKQIALILRKFSMVFPDRILYIFQAECIIEKED